ncbi:Imm61 family immunity protein [Mycobacterium sp. smrl_JER01]|uniref:Imm61 family immunity protein n=1 Tax=Mycobacterium sp. smrl_JER01 TaxID=3402633 RepID=UPI003ACE109C
MSAENGDLQFRSEVGAPTRYFVRRRGSDRFELTQSFDGDAEQLLLFVAEVAVLGQYLVGLFADDIREDLDLPFLELRYTAADLAAGYRLSEMVRGYRTLTQSDGRPVAAAPDPVLSLLALVPLSHLLGWPVADLKRSFLSPSGAPLIRNGRYAVRR